MHDEVWYAAHQVELLLGRRALELDQAKHTVKLDDGSRLSYDRLLLATGATSRRPDLPGADLDAVHYLRSVESELLREALRSGGRVVTVGAGWIGLETAAAARSYGCEVTVLEPQPVPLQAALGAERRVPSSRPCTAGTASTSGSAAASRASATPVGPRRRDRRR